MRFLTLLILSLALLSCSKDDINSSNIVGTWKLSQVLADPGDGSGTFVDVESNKFITFSSDNTFSSNENLCSFSLINPGTTTGTFSIEKEEIYPSSCESLVGITLNYSLENGELVINFLCIEACAEKYVKLKLE